MVSYEGIFFDKETVEFVHNLEEKRLIRVNDRIHCTFKYHPKDNEIFNEIVGEYFEVYLVGYGNDGKNSGFKVAISERLQEYYINYDEENCGKLKVPHITASLSNDASAVKTKNLNFIPLQKPVKLVGRFGYWIKEDGNEYLSFDKYAKEKVKEKNKLR